MTLGPCREFSLATMTGDEGTFEVRWLPHSSKVIPLHNLTSAMRLAWNTLHAGQLQSRSFFRVRSLACFCYLCELPVDFTFDEFRAAYPGVDLFTFDPDLWAGLGAHAIQRRLAVYTQACRPNLHVCTWSVTSLAALQNHHDKLAHVQVGRVKGFVLLQETNWTPAQPATLTTAHPHINIAASNLPPEQTGSGGVCILPPLGWTQIEHTEIIPGFLQDALYEKYGAQVRVINVYVHPARTKEIGARLISHLAHISDSCVVLGGDFNQLPNTQMWADLVAHFSCVSPKLTTYLSGGIGSALDRLLLRHPMVDNDSARVTYHVRWPVTRPSQHGALWGTLKVAFSISPSPGDTVMHILPARMLPISLMVRTGSETSGHTS